MENKMIAKISPIALLQAVYIWTEKGREQFEFNIQELPQKITILANQFQIENIDLIGNEAYLLKIKNDIVNNKFANQVLNITINRSKGE